MSCSKLLLYSGKAARTQRFSSKRAKSEQNLYNPFQRPGSICMTKFNNYEDLVFLYFIILVIPRMKHRIISRWCPVLYWFFSCALFSKLQLFDSRVLTMLREPSFSKQNKPHPFPTFLSFHFIYEFTITLSKT